MTDELALISETPAGGLFDPEIMEQLRAEWMTGVWFWHPDDQMLMYRWEQWVS